MLLPRVVGRPRVIGLALASVAAAATLLQPRPVFARRVSDVDFADSIRVDRTLLHLNGVAVYRKFGVRVLVAGLWLERARRDAPAILRDDAPRRYVTHFLHGVSAKRIRKAWLEGLEANSPDAGPAVQGQFQELCRWVRDFRPGDEIAVTYVPGQGSVVEIDGARVGSIPGKPFADAYFALALGPKPSLGRNFRKRLLGE